MNDTFYFEIKLSSQFIVYFNLNTHYAGLILMWTNIIISFSILRLIVSISALSEDVLDVKNILRIEVHEKVMQKLQVSDNREELIICQDLWS